MKKWLITCEHASHAIPAAYHSLFKDHQSLLKTHRGWDIGAYWLYTQLIHALPNIHQSARWSRLLIELNRSLHHHQLFSEFTKVLTDDKKEHLIEEYYQLYREKLKKHIESLLTQQPYVIHISVHSFTPTLNGEERNADIGLLYDPCCHREALFCKRWKANITSQSDFRVRMNYPYQGKSDGLCTALRKLYRSTQYLGIELEVNQALLQPTTSLTAKKLKASLIKGLTNLL